VVHTALAGRVAFAGPLAGRGVVVVDHGSTRTTYEPVLASVRVGAVLARGQAIGMLALAGSHCFPRACLHWGWKRGGTYLDPLLLVGGGPVVLLPLWRDAPVPLVMTPPEPYAGFLAHLLSVQGPVWHPPLAMPRPTFGG
jgi:murein DD-endopeptidase MepM/ murein hydrolase activator NlpD